jgi:molybdenum cofactor cytidylyltransferase
MDYNIKNLNTNVGAIILAGGLGERLKAVGLKPFLLCKGKSFLHIAVENVSSIRLNPIIIVTNDNYYEKIIALNFPAKILINPHPEHGMLSSILVGLQEITTCCSGFFLCPIDYPLVQHATYHKSLLAHRSNPDHIIKPACNDLPGHPVVFPKNLFQALRDAPLSQGARYVTRQYAHLIKIIDVDDPGILININTPVLYRQHCK